MRPWLASLGYIFQGFTSVNGILIITSPSIVHFLNFVWNPSPFEITGLWVHIAPRYADKGNAQSTTRTLITKQSTCRTVPPRHLWFLAVVIGVLKVVHKLVFSLLGKAAGLQCPNPSFGSVDDVRDDTYWIDNTLLNPALGSGEIC